MGLGQINKGIPTKLKRATKIQSPGFGLWVQGAVSAETAELRLIQRPASTPRRSTNAPCGVSVLFPKGLTDSSPAVEMEETEK